MAERLPQLAEAADPAAALAEIREAARVQGGGGKKAWSSEEVYDAFRDAAEALRETIDKVADQTAFDPGRRPCPRPRPRWSCWRSRTAWPRPSSSARRNWRRWISTTC